MVFDIFFEKNARVKPIAFSIKNIENLESDSVLRTLPKNQFVQPNHPKIWHLRNSVLKVNNLKKNKILLE